MSYKRRPRKPDVDIKSLPVHLQAEELRKQRQREAQARYRQRLKVKAVKERIMAGMEMVTANARNSKVSSNGFGVCAQNGETSAAARLNSLVGKHSSKSILNGKISALNNWNGKHSTMDVFNDKSSVMDGLNGKASAMDDFNGNTSSIDSLNDNLSVFDSLNGNTSTIDSLNEKTSAFDSFNDNSSLFDSLNDNSSSVDNSQHKNNLNSDEIFSQSDNQNREISDTEMHDAEMNYTTFGENVDEEPDQESLGTSSMPSQIGQLIAWDLLNNWTIFWNLPFHLIF